jgi:hypothetical protein
MEPIFDHEKLDVYGLELEFIAWVTDFLEEASQSPVSHRRELCDQLDRACLSVLLNTAEGPGSLFGAEVPQIEHEHDEHEHDYPKFGI